MDNFIRDFNKLSVSKRKSPKRQVQVNRIHIPEPTKILIDPTVLKINQCKLSTEQVDYYKVNNVLTYIILDRYNRDFIRIKELFAEDNFRVRSVERVDNPYIKKAFELRRHLKYNGKLPKTLFHGTKEKYIDNICTYNFNWRLGGYEKGHLYGKGVNFTPSPYFAKYFCDKGRKKVMIMAEVLVDQVEDGHENMVVPPRGFDTTTGKDGGVFVKFYDNEFYPKYIVHFDIMYR